MRLEDLIIVFLCIFLWLTAVARLFDIIERQGLFWNTRKVGMILVMVGSTIQIAAYFSPASPYWQLVMKLSFLTGFSLAWLTTPMQKPWWSKLSRFVKE